MTAYVWVLFICALNDPSNCGPVVSDIKYETINECVAALYTAREARKGLNILAASCELRDFPLELGA